jgi:hypothetical protein
VEGGGKKNEMFKLKIYHKRKECIKRKIRTDFGRQNDSGEVKKYKGEINLGKIYKSKKPPRRRRKRIAVHTCSVDYVRVQAKKSVHSQYGYSKEACCKVDSENQSWEKPKSHRTKKSGKIVNIKSGKNCENHVPGMLVKCKKFCSAKYIMSNVKKVSKVTLRNLVQMPFLRIVDRIQCV